MNLKEKLLEARALVASQATWCQNAYARTAAGYRLASPLTETAVQFCGLGAAYKVMGLEPGMDNELVEILNKSSFALFGREVASVNDKRGQAAVLAIYDHALGVKPDETYS